MDQETESETSSELEAKSRMYTSLATSLSARIIDAALTGSLHDNARNKELRKSCLDELVINLMALWIHEGIRDIHDDFRIIPFSLFGIIFERHFKFKPISSTFKNVGNYNGAAVFLMNQIYHEYYEDSEEERVTRRISRLNNSLLTHKPAAASISTGLSASSYLPPPPRPPASMFSQEPSAGIGSSRVSFAPPLLSPNFLDNGHLAPNADLFSFYDHEPSGSKSASKSDRERQSKSQQDARHFASSLKPPPLNMKMGGSSPPDDDDDDDDNRDEKNDGDDKPNDESLARYRQTREAKLKRHPPVTDLSSMLSGQTGILLDPFLNDDNRVMISAIRGSSLIAPQLPLITTSDADLLVLFNWSESYDLFMQQGGVAPASACVAPQQYYTLTRYAEQVLKNINLVRTLTSQQVVKILAIQYACSDVTPVQTRLSQLRLESFTVSAVTQLGQRFRNVLYVSVANTTIMMIPKQLSFLWRQTLKKFPLIVKQLISNIDDSAPLAVHIEYTEQEVEAQLIFEKQVPYRLPPSTKEVPKHENRVKPVLLALKKVQTIKTGKQKNFVPICDKCDGAHFSNKCDAPESTWNTTAVITQRREAREKTKKGSKVQLKTLNCSVIEYVVDTLVSTPISLNAFLSSNGIISANAIVPSVPGRITVDSDINFSTAIAISAFPDGGCNHCIIHPDIWQLLSPQSPRDRGNTITATVDIANDQPGIVSSLLQVPLLLCLSLNEVMVTIRIDALVYAMGSHNIVLSHAILVKHGLYSYLANPSTWALDCNPDPCPEETDEFASTLNLFYADIDTPNPVQHPVINFESMVPSSFPLRDALLHLLQDFSDVFGPITPDRKAVGISSFTVELLPGTSSKRFPVRRLAPRYQDFQSQEIKQLLAANIIERCDSAFASPSFVTQREDGKMRLVVDYRWLNEHTTLYHYPLPQPSDLYSHAGNHRFYGKVDATRSFNQIPVEPSCRDLLAFTNSEGTFRPCTMPFGPTNCVLFFQHIMRDEVLGPLYGIEAMAYIDDCVNWADTSEAYLLCTKKFLTCFRDHNIKLNPAKCEFGATEFILLGQIFSADGIRMTDSKRLAIQSLPTPTDSKQLRSVLGVTGYFRSHVKDYATITAPLTAMQVDQKKFLWDTIADTAFLTLKKALLNTPLLHHLRYDLPILVRTDASDTGGGSGLFNISPSGDLLLCNFTSFQFSDAATRWSTIVKEGYSFYITMRTYSPLLLGAEFVPESDHRNLLWMQNSTVPKLQRWFIQLQPLMRHNRLVHIPGPTNGFADMLSRLELSHLPVSKIQSLTVSLSTIIFNHFSPTLSSLTPPNCPLSTASQPEISNYLYAIYTSTIHNSVVGHFGSNASIKRFRALGLVWSDMAAAMKTWRGMCPICQKLTPLPYRLIAEPLHRPSSEPFATVALDYLDTATVSASGNRYILSAICETTRNIELYATRDQTAITASTCALDVWSRYGSVATLHSDNGPAFIADVIKHLCEFLCVDKSFTLAYRPQANGINERSNGETLRHLRAIVMAGKVKKNWDLYLPLVRMIMNHSYHSAIGTCPIRLLHGDFLTADRTLLTNWDVDESVAIRKPVEEYIRQLNASLRDVVTASVLYRNEQLAKGATLAARKTQLLLDQGKTPLSARIFSAGDFVLLSFPNRRAEKIAELYRGPYVVLDNPTGNTYIIRDLVSSTSTSVDASRLIPWIDNDYLVDEDAKHLARLRFARQDHDNEVVEAIVGHRHPQGTRPNKRNTAFKLRWFATSPEQDTWLPYKDVKELALLEDYLAANPELLHLR